MIKISVLWSKHVGRTDLMSNVLAILSLPFGNCFQEYRTEPPDLAGIHVNCDHQKEELNISWSYISEPVSNPYFI